MVNERYYGSEERVKWIKNQRCYVTGRVGTSGNPIVNSHIKTKGAGGGPEWVIPMLYSLEKEFHDIGIRSFEKKYGVDLEHLCRVCDQRWRAYKNGNK